MFNKFKIAAIVVTYNRLNLLRDCITSLKSQTKNIDCIIVVDNGSTDGTSFWLSKETGLTIISQDNLGSSGGQYSGLKYAFENGYDLFWCMDDDGIPDKNCLENLVSDMSYIGYSGVIGPTVLSISNNDLLAFSHLHNRKEILVKYSDLELITDKNGIIHDRINFFNGVLISHDVVKSCGLPIRDMFIWGDELEYNARISSFGFKAVSTKNALFYHPADRINYYYIFLLGRLNKVIFTNTSRDLYVYRNHFYVIFKYSGKYAFLWVLFTYLYFHIKSFRINEIIKIVKYSFFGVRGRFGKINFESN